MDSPSMNTDSFLQTTDMSLGLTFGEKMANLLSSGGIMDDLLIRPEIIDDLVGDYQEEWSLIIDTMEILPEPEIEAYEKLKLKVTEAEVDKVLNEKLGNSDSKVCITEEMVEIASFQFKESRTKYESLQKLTSHLKGQLLQCDVKLNSMDKANQKLACSINKTWASINAKCNHLVIQWNELSQVACQYLSDELPNNNSTSRSQCSQLPNEMHLKLLELLESTSQQLVKQFTLGPELAAIFTLLSEIQVKKSNNNMMKLLDKCQDELEQNVFLQKCIMADIQKKKLCQNMASEFLKLVSTSLLNFTSKFKNIKDYNKEANIVEAVNESKLSALNEALNSQSSLLTPENLISALTTLDAKLDNEETKCSLKIVNMIEQQLVEISDVHKLIKKIDCQGEELKQKNKKMKEFKTAFQHYQEIIKKLKSTYSKEELSDKDKLAKLMILYFTDHDHFLETLKEMKWMFEILSKAVI